MTHMTPPASADDPAKRVSGPVDRLTWAFPLPRTHTGVPLGNGRTGLLVWGADNVLRLTIGRADLWDHRGGMPWTEAQYYAAIRSCLESNDEAGIARIFRPATESEPGQPARPSVLPLGRLELVLREGCALTEANLSMREGFVEVIYRLGSARKALQVGLHPQRDFAWIGAAEDVEDVRVVTSWDIMGERLAALSFSEPEAFSTADGVAGWHWDLPEDPGVSVAWRKERSEILLVVDRYDGTFDSAAAASRLEPGEAMRVETLRGETRSWWAGYRDRVASVSLSNPVLQQIHDFGLYLFGALTNPNGVAATLQGPWIEEYDFPPWSSDYHFNINVQMCYSPGFRAGAFDHLRPLFDLVWSWRERLRTNARHFAGIDDGYMLPHAVDDRCTCMGSFWTGSIDHACTAWVAAMMFDYADYTGDVEFLRERAFPFMRGTLAVYRAMLEDDGEQLRLPVSVSPEYRGAQMDAWGADASFQLAALHRLCENLIVAARTLGVAADPSWADIGKRLPGATTADGRIMLWEGVDLEESHRHHSHLAGIAPFDTLDFDDGRWREVIDRSLRHWIRMGMGLWSGWCMSWASALHSRVGNGEGAELMLELWQRVFTNEGRASMHDATINGITLMGAPPLIRSDAMSPDGEGAAGRGSTGTAILRQAERMQMDGAMGGVAAVQEMLLHDRRGVLRFFRGVPASWPRASFERFRAPGGFLVSGWWDRAAGWRVEVYATRPGRLRLELPGSELGRYEPVEMDVSGGRRVEFEGTWDAG